MDVVRVDIQIPGVRQEELYERAMEMDIHYGNCNKKPRRHLKLKDLFLDFYFFRLFRMLLQRHIGSNLQCA